MVVLRAKGVVRAAPQQHGAIGHGTLAATPCALAIAGDFVSDPSVEPEASCIADLAEFTTGTADPGGSDDPGASAAPTPSEGPAAEPSATPKPARVPKARNVEIGLVKAKPDLAALVETKFVAGK